MILTNTGKRILKAKVIETGLSDFHRMIAFLYKLQRAKGEFSQIS